MITGSAYVAAMVAMAYLFARIRKENLRRAPNNPIYRYPDSLCNAMLIGGLVIGCCGAYVYATALAAHRGFWREGFIVLIFGSVSLVALSSYGYYSSLSFEVAKDAFRKSSLFGFRQIEFNQVASLSVIEDRSGIPTLVVTAIGRNMVKVPGLLVGFEDLIRDLGAMPWDDKVIFRKRDRLGKWTNGW